MFMSNLFFFSFPVVSIASFVMQIYVEIERARLIKKIAKVKEEQGLIAEAVDFMPEIAVTRS